MPNCHWGVVNVGWLFLLHEHIAISYYTNNTFQLPSSKGKTLAADTPFSFPSFGLIQTFRFPSFDSEGVLILMSRLNLQNLHRLADSRQRHETAELTEDRDRTGG